jgi:hypothetical protein
MEQGQANGQMTTDGPMVEKDHLHNLLERRLMLYSHMEKGRN